MTSIIVDRLDGLSSSVAIKGPCKVATTANITLSGTQTIDGVLVAVGDRVLVKNQTTASENGIYYVDTGSWRRTKDFSRSNDIVTGTQVFVTSGTVAGGASFIVATTGAITIGTTSITFSQSPSLSSFGGSAAGIQLFKYSFASVKDFEDNTSLTYSHLAAGDRIQIHIYAFEVAATGASDAHLTSAGGIKAYYRSAKSTAVASPVVGPDGFASFLAFGVKGNGTTDDTTKMQAALASGHRDFLIPSGANILISDTLREATNGGALRIRGGNKYHAKITADPAFPAGEPMIWVGNSNGHGNYRFQGDYFRLVGDNGCIGLRLHEAGTSNVDMMRIDSCAVGINAPGMIGSFIERCDFSTNTIAMQMVRVPLGTPADADDITVTASPLSLVTNINTIRGNWVTGGSQAVYVEGGLCVIEQNTFQNVGGISDDVVLMVNANGSLTFGGGPVIQNNWFESATVRSLVRLTNTRQVNVSRNFLSVKGTSEQTIIADSTSSQLTVERNAFVEVGAATPTESRTQNAVIYTDAIATTLIDNSYGAFPSRSYAQLVKLSRTTTSNNIVIEKGQNGGTPMGVEFGNLSIGIGSTAQISPNTNTSGAFNSYIIGMQKYNCGAVVSAQTGTTFTLVLTNGSGIVTMNNASANTVTIPTNASVTYTIGTIIDIVQIGAGATSVTASVGVTLNGTSAGTVAGPGQYKSLRLIKTAANTWVAV